MIDPVQNSRPLSRRTMLRTLIVAAAVVPLAACSAKEDNLTAQANSGDGKNYIAGDGAVQEYTPDLRTDPVKSKPRPIRELRWLPLTGRASRWS